MVYRLVFVCFFLSLINPTKINAHAVYVSVCNVFPSDGGGYVFSFRIFKDDIFDALGFAGSSKDIKNEDEIIFTDYIKKNFFVKVGEVDLSFNVKRFVFEGSDYTETLNVVLESKKTQTDKVLSIKNTLLFDKIDGQMNIVSIKRPEGRKTLTFKKTPEEKWEKVI